MRNGGNGKGTARGKVLPVRLGGKEARTLKRAARLAGVPLSTYMRDASMQSAQLLIAAASISVPPRHTAECGDETQEAA